MKKLLLLMIAVGFALFPSTALAENTSPNDEGCVPSNDHPNKCNDTEDECQQDCDETPECQRDCFYIGILPTTTTTAAPTTTTTEALPTTTVSVLGQVITQTPAPPSDPGVLPITGGDVLGLTAIGVALAAIGFGLTRARRSEA